MVKDLGRQIGWSTVFYVEYLGPIIIIPIMYWMGKRSKYELSHNLGAVMGVLHFIKREF
jgi:very-long-chain enoyl-CoA reductase